MGDELTSVAVRQSRKAQLDDLKRSDKESYNDVIGRLLDGDGGNGDRQRLHQLLSDVGADPEAIAREVWAQAEYGRIADETAREIEGRLR